MIDETLDESNALVCTVVSFVPFRLKEDKPGLVPPYFLIKESDTIDPQVLHIKKALHYVYLDDTRGSLQVRDSPDEVARSVVEDYIGSQLRVDENSRPGLFWVPGKWSAAEVKIKFKDKIAEVLKKQNSWFVQICRLADDDWNKFHQHNVVSDFQRKAAHLIGWRREEHEWMNAKSTEGSKTCPSCSMLNAPNIVVCPSCKCILDPEKYKTLTFAT